MQQGSLRIIAIVIGLMSFVLPQLAWSGSVVSFFSSNEYNGKPRSCSDKQAPNHYTPNPFHIASGNKFYEEKIFRGGGEFPLEFSLYYNSSTYNEIGTNQFMAGEWTYSYGQHLLITQESGGSIEKIEMKRPDGRRIYFERNPSTGGVFQSVRRGDRNGTGDDRFGALENGTLVYPGGGVYIYTTVDGIKETYDSAGFLTEVKNLRTGGTHYVTYNLSPVVNDDIAPEMVGLMTVTYSERNEAMHIELGKYNEVKFKNNENDTRYRYMPRFFRTPTGVETEFVRQPAYGGDNFGSGNPQTHFTYFKGIYDSIEWPTGERTTFEYTPLSETGGNPIYFMTKTLLTGINRINLDSSYTRQEVEYKVMTDNGGGYERVRATRSAIGHKALGSAEDTKELHWLDEFDPDWDGGHNWVIRNKHNKKYTYNFQHNTNTNQVYLYSVVGDELTYGNCASSNTIFTYDGNGFLDTKIDYATGAVLEDYDFSSDGRLLSQSLPTAPGGAVNYVRNGYNQPTQISKPNHSTIDITYENGRISTYTVTDDKPPLQGYTRAHSLQRQWSFAYTYHGGNTARVETVTVTGPRNDTTVYTYNTVGNLVNIENALNQTIQFLDHDERGRPKQMLDLNNVTTYLTYDAIGRLKTIASGGNLTVFDYNLDGQLSQVDLSDGVVIQYDYSIAGRLKTVTNQFGERLEITRQFNTGAGYQAEDRAISTYDIQSAQHLNVEMTFDGLGRFWKQYDHIAGNTTTMEVNYDRFGNPDKIFTSLGNGLDNLEIDTNYLYSGELYQIIDNREIPQRNTSIQYDEYGQVKRVSELYNTATQYTYDGLGNLLMLESPDSGTTTYYYDDAGNVTSVLNANGSSVSYTYDSLNRLTFIDYPNQPDVTYDYGTTPYSQGKISGVSTGTTNYVTWDYDWRGNIVRDERQIDGQTYITDYQYTNGNRLLAINYPSGRGVDYNRSQGVVDNIRMQGTAEQIALSITYEPFGPVNWMWYGNQLSSTTTYDTHYQPETIVTEWQSQRWQDYDFWYSIGGNLEEASDLVYDWSRTYLYSGRSELVYEKMSDPAITSSWEPITLNYDYDRFSNRIQKDYSESSSGYSNTETYIYNYDGSNNLLSNRIASIQNSDPNIPTTNFTYSNTGDIQQAALTYTWNDAGQMVSALNGANVIGQYGYNPLGQRQSKSTTSGTKHFIYGLNGELLSETDSSNGAGWFRDYIYHEGKLIAFAEGGTDWAGAYPDGTAGPTFYQTADSITIDRNSLTQDSYFAYRPILGNGGIDGGFSFDPAITGQQVGIEMRNSTDPASDYYLLSRRTELVSGVTHYIYELTKRESGVIQVVWSLDSTTNDYPYLGLTRAQNTLWISASEDSVGWTNLTSYNPTTLNANYLVGFRANLPTAGDSVTFTDLRLYGSIEDNTSLYFVHTDHLGTPQLITDENKQVVWRAVYDGFGKTLAVPTENIVNNIRFPGQYYDSETGLHYNYYRYYDPSMGRYVSSDPIGLEGGLNSYSYAEANPNRYIDPYGLDTLLIFSGSKLTNPFGHSALAFTGQGVYSYGTKHLFGSNTTKYLYDESNSRNLIAIVLKTTPEQERKMIEVMEKFSGSEYGYVTNNCATTNIEALEAAGITPNAFGAIPFLPISIRDIGWAQPGMSSTFIPQGGSIPDKFKDFDRRPLWNKVQ